MIINEHMQEGIARAKELCEQNGVELLYMTLFGSSLYGTATPGKSDLDIKGIFLPSLKSLVFGEAPRSLHWSSGDDVHRNTAEDMDIDLWSLQYWLLKLLPIGDTGACDVLFSPSNAACTIFRDCRLDGVFNNPDRFLDAKHCRAYADYSMGQAKKYGIKGSRLGALRAVHKWVQAHPDLDPLTRLGSIQDKLVAECGDGRYCTLVDSATGPALQLCGKIHVGGIRIREFVQRVVADMKKYGTRAIEAEKNQGLDFKALSHALRAFDQMEELYKTGRIVFPLATRERLMQVKQGEIPWVDLEPIIVERLKEIDAIREASDTKVVYNLDFAKAQIEKCYGFK